MRNDIRIRPFAADDWGGVWRVLRPVFADGDSYPVAPNISETEAQHYWLTPTKKVYVATGDNDSDILGTYYIQPNQPTLGAHVCNCGYAVLQTARRCGIGSQLCVHSQQEALVLGYRAMQYNLVVANNAAAVQTWLKHGFRIIGTLEGAFLHKQAGFVDALVMYKTLCP